MEKKLKLVVNEMRVFKETLIEFKKNNPNRVYILSAEAKKRLEQGLDVVVETIPLKVLKQKFPHAKQDLVLFYYEKG